VPDEQVLARVLRDFARTLTHSYEVAEVLSELTDHVVAVLDAACAGVMVADGDVLRYATASDERATRVEQVQEDAQSGPCHEAYVSGEVVAVRDLDDCGRWPRYSEMAEQVGLRAVLGVPMQIDGARVGALNTFASIPRTWDDADVAAARVLADVATSFLAHASELDRARRTAEQLQHALDSRVVLEQAKGMVAAHRGIQVDEAFRVLRRHARDRGATLHSVAQAVVELGLRP